MLVWLSGWRAVPGEFDFEKDSVPGRSQSRISEGIRDPATRLYGLGTHPVRRPTKKEVDRKNVCFRDTADCYGPGKIQ